jgi:hypothetical protein
MNILTSINDNNRITCCLDHFENSTDNFGLQSRVILRERSDQKGLELCGRDLLQ